MAAAGSLPPSCRYLVTTRLAFVGKPGTEVPRPISPPEVLNRVIGKDLCHRLKAGIGDLCAHFEQFGVSLPGGIEGLFHSWRQLERMAAVGELRPIATLDVVFVNAFGIWLWDSIMASLTAVVQEDPNLVDLTRWDALLEGFLDSAIWMTPEWDSVHRI